MKNEEVLQTGSWSQCALKMASGLPMNLGAVAQVSQPAVSPTSSRPGLRQCHGSPAFELLQARCLRYSRLEVCATRLAQRSETPARFMGDNARASGQWVLTLILSPGGERKSLAVRVRS